MYCAIPSSAGLTQARSQFWVRFLEGQPKPAESQTRKLAAWNTGQQWLRQHHLNDINRQNQQGAPLRTASGYHLTDQGEMALPVTFDASSVGTPFAAGSLADRLEAGLVGSHINAVIGQVLSSAENRVSGLPAGQWHDYLAGVAQLIRKSWTASGALGYVGGGEQ